MKHSCLIFLYILAVLLIGSCASKALVQVAASVTPVPPTYTPVPTNTSTKEPGEATASLPPLESWQDVPIMPGATSGEFELKDYVFKIPASPEEITTYYETTMAELGWQPRDDMTAQAPGTAFTFFKDGIFVFFMIQSEGGNQVVFMHFVEG